MTKPRTRGGQDAELGETAPGTERHTPRPSKTPLRRAETILAPVRTKISTPSSVRGRGTPVPVPNGDALIGSLVGTFRIVEELGRGGMGTVYLGQHAHIGSKVAIKFLHEALASDEALVQRFFAEARAVNLIGHDNIVRIFDFGLVPPKRHYMVMEYLVGQELQAVLGRPMGALDVVPMLLQICDALEAAHQAGIVHRDLKPANLYLVKRGREERFVKVLDFGIAKLAEQHGGARSAVGTVIGTPEYMAPEQALGSAVDGRSDLYSLGVIAYELLTGRLPFLETQFTRLLLAHAQQVPEPPHVVNPAVPPGLSKTVMRALEKKPEFRFQTARELATALEAGLLEAASHAAPAPVTTGVGMFESAPPRTGFVVTASPVPKPQPVPGSHLGRPSVEGLATSASPLPAVAPRGAVESMASPVPRIKPLVPGSLPSDWGRAVPPELATKAPPARSPDGGSEESGRFGGAAPQVTPYAGSSSVNRGGTWGGSSSSSAEIAQWLESEVSGVHEAPEVAPLAGALAAGAPSTDSGRKVAPLADGFTVTTPSSDSGVRAAPLANGFTVTTPGTDSGVRAAPSAASRSPSGMVVSTGLFRSEAASAVATPYAGSSSVVRGTPAAGTGTIAPTSSSPSGRAPAPARSLPPFEALVSLAQGAALGTFTCRDLSKGGLYVCMADAAPALRSRVLVALPQGPGLKLEAEVVHQVTAAQSTSWGLPAGFAVQFVGLSALQKESLEALLTGTPLPTPRASVADDVELLSVLNRYARAEDGDHYRVLGVALVEDFESIRLKGLERKAELSALLEKHRDGPRGPALEAAAKRLRSAIETLSKPALRLEYDVQRKNHLGVERCLASDLSPIAVAAIRRRFLDGSPKAESEATVRSMMAKAFEQKRQLHQALQHHHEALEADPLHPESQPRYWVLKRQLG